MNKLEQLIQELCPNGVEYKKLGEVAEIGTGSSNGNEAEENGLYPFFIRSKNIKSKNSYQFDEEAIIIPGEGGIGDIFHYTNGKYALHQRVYRIHFLVSFIYVKFIYYYMISNFKTFITKKAVNATVTSIRKPMIEDFLIPVPPLEVQKEIVRILDTFTELEKELEKELEARKKQYEFYREQLLSFDENVPLVSLSEIALDMYRGAGIKRDEVREKGTPCVRYGEIYTDYNIWFDKCLSYTDENLIQSKKYFEKNDILFAITGEKVEEISKSCAYIGEEKCLAGGDIVVMKHNQNAKYLSYALSTFSACKQKSSGKVKSKVVHSSIPELKKIKIPLPPLEEQERIVNILDRFDALCNDLTCGLPAEIEARRKQYAYYRDKLLTFKNIAENSC